MTNQVREATADAVPLTSWAGYGGCAWALAYVPIHIYWAITGSSWPFGELPASLQVVQWREANWAATVVITSAAVVSLALVQPWARRLPRRILLGVVWTGAVFAVLHWLVISTQILLLMIGITGGVATKFDRWNLFVFEPWFLIMGMLLAVAAAQYARRGQGPGLSGPVASAHSPTEIASVAFVVGGALVVLVGVMTFQAWAYAAIGPGLIGIGVLGRLVTRSVIHGV